MPVSPRAFLARLRHNISALALSHLPEKNRHELLYWRSTKRKEGDLSNAHYQHFYTTLFGLTADSYRGLRVLDVGCGPRGSLEWATEALERVGIDSLVPEYLKLGADKHKMTYVHASAERIPFADGHFDIVCSFNSLDHVDRLDDSLAEIHRVLKSGGLFLLIVEANHEATETEPISIPWDIRQVLGNRFDILTSSRYEIGDHNVYGQIRKNMEFNENDPSDREGILCSKLKRIP